MFKGKNVLVTGGTGMIGQQLVRLLLEEKANVKIISLDDKSLVPEGCSFEQVDLTEFSNCKNAVSDMDYVFNLIGIKSSPIMCKEKPATFFVPYLQFNTNLMEAARLKNVEWYLYTSTVGVYTQCELMKEDDVWNTFPSKHDWFAGWAKRMGELQAEAYKIQYDWNKVSIIRPANVYGPFDTFDPKSAMVVPALIGRVLNGENALVVWGDGSPIRDFVHSKDVARAMMFAVENKINEPLNSGSGKGISIRELVNIIVNIVNPDIEIEWDTTKPNGDSIRILDMTKLFSYGFRNIIDMEEGIRDTINWYNNNKELHLKRFNFFK